ncbi:MAG TPA: ribonuclease III [Polyangiaceae bacterium]|nr:ribonuclease III [Polyangiaceae bacterium]
MKLPAPLEAFLGGSEDLPHLAEALTHPSWANEHKQGTPRPDYQRLEFLGDAVLSLAVSEALMQRFPDAREGDLSFRRASIVSTEALAKFARELEVGRALALGRGADAAGERDQPSVLADATEAIFGAVYTDRGFEAARRLAAVVCERAEHAPMAQIRDAKSALQERVQAKGGTSPRYALVSANGPDHQREFVVEVEALGEILGRGAGRSKKAAEQAAAQTALSLLASRE